MDDMSDFNPRTYTGLEQMRSGQWYLPGSEELVEQHEKAARISREFNELANTDPDRAGELLAELLAPGSKVPEVFAPAYIEYGCHTRVGEGVFFNYNTVILDIAEVTIGDRTLFGPGCQLITVGHPVNDLEMRRGGWEQGKPIVIGDDCWFGAGVLVMPGVTIGDRCVIGAGALVTRDIPDDCLALGSPAKVVRRLNTGDAYLEREELPEGVPVGGNRLV